MYASASSEGRKPATRRPSLGAHLRDFSTLGEFPMTRTISPCMTLCLMLTPLLGMAQETASPAQELKSFLAKPADKRGDLAEQSFAQAALTKQEAEAARQLLIADWRQQAQEERAAELATG